MLTDNCVQVAFSRQPTPGATRSALSVDRRRVESRGFDDAALLCSHAATVMLLTSLFEAVLFIDDATQFFLPKISRSDAACSPQHVPCEERRRWRLRCSTCYRLGWRWHVRAYDSCGKNSSSVGCFSDGACRRCVARRSSRRPSGRVGLQEDVWVPQTPPAL